MKVSHLFGLLPTLLLGLISLESRVSADKILIVIEDGVERSNYQLLWSSLNANISSR
ncbi:oligosaccharyl transferase glycoprotein complex, beta subunit [Puccinia graminis f. sp. tritici]|uniref:Oligosaccharyl transferase glycoprotein complex, beta subunit n=1 Tax=Puccinia graminis f. sp. tritici TaxID=56615 RepID=A0A5B0RNK9_PUCGR|nr:oligosaccharyl transferase glycoprotein complex, beta subunit [Puccinia graminis f. sp. tritici]